MIESWTAADVRAAEVPLLDAGYDLMELAAIALATTSMPVLFSGDEEPDQPAPRVALLVGSGANGGDALFAGAILAGRAGDDGAFLAEIVGQTDLPTSEVVAVCTSPQVHEAGLAALREAGGRVVDVCGGPTDPAWSGAVADVLAADLVLDGLVGIGGVGPLRGIAAEFVRALSAAGELTQELTAQRPNSGPGFVIQGASVEQILGPRPGRRRPRVVAVDLPSGIGVDDGTVAGPVMPADVTMTFGATKPGLLLPPAAHLVGDVHFVDIGLSQPIVDQGLVPAVMRMGAADVAELWPVPGVRDHKYTRGVVGLVAGTSHFPGAAVLAATAAVRSGAGMVRYLGPEAVASTVVSARPEVVPAAGRVQAWAVGPGLPGIGADGGGPPAAGTDGAAQHARVREALEQSRGIGPDGTEIDPVPVVADAGALDVVATVVQDGHRLAPHVLLTPHAGELARLLRALGERTSREDVEAAPLAHARRAHELTGATVLVKGSVTIVFGPDAVFSQAEAPTWLATAGAGDVLTGILGTLLAARSAEAVATPGLTSRLAAAGAFVHGHCADRANPGGPVAALDVADAVSSVIAEILLENDA
ncbi:NAD(P)H-hydrate repair enzyme Nnr, NAD(P)H-hydrate dehydratase domain [Paraoerskovia marina]|uniref:ADP-dependent (S)-NAD(P)H-hydrate dehydratase n=1 Tax=Paraoerskovia marina TaxID=545619 RepID=A0A1H1V8T7_9CELL|nr:bifunctional ADP-dependent NAD(P)H-hydrate dehydratase/NAD(P)H-hydrate epimerase [Paraoerskovia marina]SDS80669.1 NAD(P)H-hydrate repair enzyme Nnr, NAD(P)H-hydrate dehydratase domain [Paraoerskovia marina]